jgi:ketosteroid isomerase-like protein
MKKIALFLSCFAGMALLQAQPAAYNKKQAVQQTVIQFFAALAARDSAALKMHCMADITLHEYGQVWNIDTLILKAITLNQAPDFTRSNQFEFIKTETARTQAWVTYRLQSVITKEGKQTTLQWLETVVLVKEARLWKVKHLHSTLLKRS